MQNTFKHNVHDTDKGDKTGRPNQPYNLQHSVYNICLRMIATTGHAVTTEGLGNHNAGEYADDAAIITKSPTSMNYILNNTLAPFCDFTDQHEDEDRQV